MNTGIWKSIPFLVSIALLLAIVLAGILAPVIAPHDPLRGNLRERNVPPAWAGEKTAIKTVVLRVTRGNHDTQISLENALQVNPEARLGESVEVVTWPEGSTQHLLGTDTWAATCCPASSTGPGLF